MQTNDIHLRCYTCGERGDGYRWGWEHRSENEGHLVEQVDYPTPPLCSREYDGQPRCWRDVVGEMN